MSINPNKDLLTSEQNSFTSGTFKPAPKRAPIYKMLAGQGRIETLLFLRHGEQQLLSILVPMLGLCTLAFLPIIPGTNRLHLAFPVILSIASLSSGFTGQAISLAFDRRYGALKRTGASGVPAWTIIFGKVIAVIAVTLVQLLILGSTALVLGWSVPAEGLLIGTVTLMAGVAAFTAMGLLMGGTLSSELVLALANLIWVILTGLASWAIFTPGVNANGILSVIPSVALAEGLLRAFDGSVPWLQLVSLLTWLVVVSCATIRYFSFDSGR